MKKSAITIIVSALTVLASCGGKAEKEAAVMLDKAKEAYEDGSFSLAKNRIDSMKTMYPKAFKAREEGLKLMRLVEIGEQEKTIAFLDSIADINDNISEEGTAIENLADLLTTQVVTTTHMSLSFKGNDFVYLFNEIIGEAQNMSDEYADLKELIDMFSVDGNIPLEIHEITLTNSDGAVNVRTVFGLNITKFKSQIDEVLQSVPAFIRPNIGTTLYITSNSTLTVSAENGELGVDSGSTLRINTMDENMSSSILNLIISMMDAPDMTPQTVAELISSVFTRISNNLGGVGTLSGQTPTYGAAAISGEPAANGGTINLVTRVTSVVTQPQE